MKYFLLMEISCLKKYISVAKADIAKKLAAKSGLPTNPRIGLYGLLHFIGSALKVCNIPYITVKVPHQIRVTSDLLAKSLFAEIEAKRKMETKEK